ncbi:hypothetical protein ABZX12_25410 [Kribbella sp. NPDC003505]|uniref:hypothetical protein n=1 Tax=Kribbella sp. NPDC003505 TaxID=3154448 RepID=UPI00339EBA8C
MTQSTDDFEEFARARTPQLYRSAWLLAGEHHLAEDLVQETRSAEQVAYDLGKNTGAIRTRTSRALDRLRAVLGDEAIHLAAL